MAAAMREGCRNRSGAWVGDEFVVPIQEPSPGWARAFFNTVLAHFIYLNDRPSWCKAAGRVLCFAGLVVVNLAGLSAEAFSLWGVLLKFNKVSRVTVFNFLIPIFGAGLSALFLGESPWAWKNLLALALVSLGIWWVTQEPAAPAPP